MKIGILIYLLLLPFVAGIAQQKDTLINNAVQDTLTPAHLFDMLSLEIRELKYEKQQAFQMLQEVLFDLRNYYKEKGGKIYSKSDWIFPVRGYGNNDIGGGGTGFVDVGYDYFKGKLNGGHPAHDIFAADYDNDCLDDYTKKPIEILSVSGGVVVSMRNDWVPGDTLKGGNYIYIYDPNFDAFFYYAHNKEVLVKMGDIIQPGDVIAHMGRTGKNAWPKRSPTHLHLMVLKVENGYPKAYNPIKELKEMKKLPKKQ